MMLVTTQSEQFDDQCAAPSLRGSGNWGGINE